MSGQLYSTLKYSGLPYTHGETLVSGLLGAWSLELGAESLELARPPGTWDSHIHMGVPYERPALFDPQVYGTPIYTWGPHMRKHYSYNASGPEPNPDREPIPAGRAAIPAVRFFFVSVDLNF